MHKHHPWRVVKDGARFRGQWLCKFMPRRGIAVVCGRWYKSRATAEAGVKSNVDKKQVSQIKKGGRFETWRWPAYSTRRKRNPDHHHTCALPGKASAPKQKNPKGAPDLADLGAVVELGSMRELVTQRENGEQVAYTWARPQPLLLWSPKQRALVWVEGIKASRLRLGAPRTDGAAKVFENWAGGEAGQHRELELPGKRFHPVGRAVSIAYTEPFGRHADGPVLWDHDFSRSDTFYQAGQNSPFVFAVTGPRLAVTARGIVN
jgi:hypothetical protein